MSFTHGSISTILLNATNVSAFLNSHDQTVTMDTADVTTFSSASKSYLAGHTDGTVSLSGFWDAAAGAIDPIMAGIIGSSTASVLSVCEEGAATVGNRALVVQSHDTSYQITGAVGDAVAVSAEFQIDGTGSSGAYRGNVLAPLTSYGTSVDTTNLDNVTGTTNGLQANLHMVVNTVATTVKIQHSTDASTWADLITFAALSAPGAEHKVATGTVHRYLRVNVTAASGSRTLAVTAARR